jgi:hypothetical protein
VNRSLWRTWLKAIPGIDPAPECPAFEELLQVVSERKPQALEIALVLVPTLALTGAALATVAAILAGSVAIGIGVGVAGCAIAAGAGWLLRRSVTPAARTASKLRSTAYRVKEKHHSWSNQTGLKPQIDRSLYPLLEEIAERYLLFQSAVARLDPQVRDGEAVSDTSEALDEALLRTLQIAEQCERRSYSVGQDLQVLESLSAEMGATVEAISSKVQREPVIEDDVDLSIERLRRSRRKLEERAKAWEELHDG